ncbi:MAG: peptidoglycan editing factor PgeF [Sulfurovum sp.]|nr:peptidoglycan editing factor PgeF [Sulfurovum sp.]
MISFYQFKKFDTIPSCMHRVTTKVRNEPYHGSMALHTGENTKDIIDNRKKIARHLRWGYKSCFIVANQTHSDNIYIISEPTDRGWLLAETVVENCDALITNKKNIILTILTADCVPILLMDKEKDVIAAVHAGWRGTKSDILSKTVKKMCDIFHCDTKDIIAGIGPAIGVCCYEVDCNVAKYFSDSEAIPTEIVGKYMLDLAFANKQQLLNVGLLNAHIEMSNICTACEVDRFFSYRKEKGCSGRFMSMIGLQ